MRGTFTLIYIQMKRHHPSLLTNFLLFLTFLLPGPPVTFQSLAPAAAPAPRSPVSLGTNMEELLKGIPPNVSIPTTADQQQGEARTEQRTRL